MIYRALACLLALLAADVCWAESSDPVPAIGAVTPSLVRVEYTLRYDKGEKPKAGGWEEGGCPVRGRDALDAETPLEDERPMELGGYLVSPTQVVAPDPMIHPRFVEGVAVRFGEDVVKVRATSFARDSSAMLLELERPLKGAKPLVFDAKKKAPYQVLAYRLSGSAWTVAAEGMPSTLSASETGRCYYEMPLSALVVDAKGTAVGLVIGGEAPADGSWKGSPLAWKFYSPDDMAKMLADVEKRVVAGAVPVTLFFRSPKKDAGASMRMRDEENENATEMPTTGLAIGDNRILILASLKPKMTARLERILVRPAGGEPVAAKFASSLKDYGCLVATLEKPLPATAAFSARPIQECRAVLLPSVEIRLHGEARTLYYGHHRIEGFHLGWRRQVYPDLSGSPEGVVLFDPEGGLLALPVVKRPSVTTEDSWSRDEAVLTPAVALKAVLDDLAKHVDTHNVPLTEEEESRLAWLGVELQGLDKELARANKVADLTRDGETGAVVSYVYPDSPAAKAGIESGTILLRLQVEGRPKPVEVQVDRDADDGPFPWEELDDVPEQVFERIPTPWPNAENRFTRALTDLGFGTKFTAEFFHDGKVVTKTFEVSQGPATYESAPRYKSPALGITVRDLTFEVRRYFQKKTDEPGVVVSKIEPGSKASVGGVKPFEIITHVNQKPIMTVKDFEAAIGGQDELRLSVKRMTRGREVKIKMTGPAPVKDSTGEKPERPRKKPAADEKAVE